MDIFSDNCGIDQGGMCPSFDENIIKVHIFRID